MNISYKQIQTIFAQTNNQSKCVDKEKHKNLY